jgi:hypothetical protein
MTDSLPTLEARRGEVLSAITRLGDMRPGSIVGAVRRCGKPTCHCAQPDDPGHGPSLRLTYKQRGKTVTEALPDRASVRKAEQEVAEFRHFRQLSEELVEVSAQICRLRPTAGSPSQEQEKKRPRPSGRRSHRK